MEWFSGHPDNILEKSKGYMVSIFIKVISSWPVIASLVTGMLLLPVIFFIAARDRGVNDVSPVVLKKGSGRGKTASSADHKPSSAKGKGIKITEERRGSPGDEEEEEE